MKNPKVLVILGTRPEAIKLAPVIMELERRGVDYVVCSTGQHRDMLDQMLDLFGIEPKFDLGIMTPGRTLGHITSRSLEALDDVIDQTKPDYIVVQGDTNSAFAGALAAYYNRVPVIHIEAGLRTNNKYSPFPEEINRRLITQIAEINFTPTDKAKGNLLAEGIPESIIHTTGNTVVDALLWVGEKNLPPTDAVLRSLDPKRRWVLVTTHRRENLGSGMQSIFTAIKRLAGEYKDVDFLFPIHLNPTIREHAEKVFGDTENIHTTAPFSYSDLVYGIKHCYFIMTDSGGIQEEAPSLGKPLLVLRDTTERPEGIEAGTALLVGTNEEAIYNQAKKLLDDKEAYNRMAKAKNPYGDGKAAARIVDIILETVAQNA